MTELEAKRHIVLCADSSYAAPLAVALRSISNSQPRPADLRIIVLGVDLPVELRDRIVQSVPELDVSFVSIDEMIPPSIPRQRVFSRAIMGRLFAPSLLADRADRILYLDADTLVTSDLSPLFEVDLGLNAVAAVRDAGIPQVATPMGLSDWKAIGLDPATPYLNSGVLAISTPVWRKEDLGTRVLDFIGAHPEVLWPDQDGLNGVIRGNFVELPPQWNAGSHLRAPLHLGYAFWSTDQVEAARDRPAVIHYTSRPKPWQHGCGDPASPLWWQVVSETSWRGIRPAKMPLWRQVRHRIGLALRG